MRHLILFETIVLLVVASALLLLIHGVRESNDRDTPAAKRPLRSRITIRTARSSAR